MTAIHSTIERIENGLLYLGAGVTVHVTPALLAHAKIGQSITLFLLVVEGKRGTTLYFGFETKADRDCFAKWMEYDSSDPIGTLSMFAAGLLAPEPPDEGAEAALEVSNALRGFLKLSKEDWIVWLRKTDKSKSPSVRANQAFDACLASRGIKVENK